MGKRLCALVAVLILIVAVAEAQDVRTVLQTASAAMGAGNLKSIQYTGTGWNAAVGQSFSATWRWRNAAAGRTAANIDRERRLLLVAQPRTRNGQVCLAA